MKMWSSFEALVVEILEVKTDYNLAARFKSYSFFKKQHMISASLHFFDSWTRLSVFVRCRQKLS
jgi:hypothetical protein